MTDVNIPIQMAPENLNQPILPGWQFSLFSVNLGATSDATVEKEAIRKVGSYGKQLGHLAEALEVVIEHLKLLEAEGLSTAQKDVLRIFLGDVSKVRGLKKTKG
jgi:hypothetical protein